MCVHGKLRLQLSFIITIIFPNSGVRFGLQHFCARYFISGASYQRPEDAILDRPMSKLKKQAGRHLPPRVYSSYSDANVPHYAELEQ